MISLLLLEISINKKILILIYIYFNINLLISDFHCISFPTDWHDLLYSDPSQSLEVKSSFCFQIFCPNYGHFLPNFDHSVLSKSPQIPPAHLHLSRWVELRGFSSDSLMPRGPRAWPHPCFNENKSLTSFLLTWRQQDSEISRDKLFRSFIKQKHTWNSHKYVLQKRHNKSSFCLNWGEIQDFRF